MRPLLKPYGTFGGLYGCAVSKNEKTITRPAGCRDCLPTVLIPLAGVRSASDIDEQAV